MRVCVRVMIEKCKYLAKMRVIYICIVEMGAVMYSSFCSWPIFSSLPVRPTRRLIVVTIHHHHQPRPQPRPQSENKNANNATSVFVCLAHICTYTHTDTNTFVLRPIVCLAVSGCMSFPLLSFNSPFKPYAYACMHVCVFVHECECDGLQHIFYHSWMLTFCRRRICCLTQQHFCQFDSLLCQFINN